ncbi:hypothetical protein FOA52_014035 [Chlamydomonas sp. UWO 241]|nr:hypothetical protein FOA52_014035 [Chlamydomonas sp. UWO 241]
MRCLPPHTYSRPVTRAECWACPLEQLGRSPGSWAWALALWLRVTRAGRRLGWSC